MPTHPPHLQPVATPATRAGADASTLVAAAIGGDVAAWGELYRREFAGVFRHVRYLTGDKALAEELAQETFAQAIAGVQRFDARRPFRPWLHGIALNVVRKSWEKSRSRTKALAKLEVVSTNRAERDDVHLQRERSRALYAALQELPDRWREAFVLRELQGLDADEAARQLEVTTGNLHVRVTRARARLRELLTARGWIDEPPAGGES
jgi:RNA polymerase sigma-70 factor (ECF subfamily)